MTPRLIIRIYDPEEIEKLTNKQEEKIINLYLKNEESLREIGDRFDYAVSTIVKILKENKIKINKTRII